MTIETSGSSSLTERSKLLDRPGSEGLAPLSRRLPAETLVRASAIAHEVHDLARALGTRAEAEERTTAEAVREPLDRVPESGRLARGDVQDARGLVVEGGEAGERGVIYVDEV